MIDRFFFKHIDNSALIVFRICFGFLLACEAFGAILTGWVKRTLIDPQFTFSFIGFEWLQPLPGNWMYAYYAIMGVFGVFIMLGYRYRLSVLGYGLLWAGTYLMQKSSYNNHYYLLNFLCLIMALQPANTYASLDVKHGRVAQAISAPRWTSWVLIIQMWIVYTYASVAKMYPDWLDTSIIEILMKSKEHYYIIGDLLQEKWMHYFIGYSGLIFDLVVIPLLLWKRTRLMAFAASVFFHMFNSIVFQVGIFPYMSLALCLFFFDPKTIHKIFLKRKPFFNGDILEIPKYKKTIFVIGAIYFLVHIALPLRHWFIQDNVLWTEEGHRLSWRMMLRSRQGIATYKVVDVETGNVTRIDLKDFLTLKQRHMASTRPDTIWQFAQFLEREYEKDGKTVEVYVDCHVSVNGRPYKRFIDHEVNLADIEWDHFRHHDWILPSDLDRKTEPNP